MSAPIDPAMLNAKLERLHEDVVDMKSSLNKMADAITKVALVEERLAHAALGLERAFQMMEKLESRVSTLEAKMPDADRAGRWIDRGVWAMAAAALMFVAKKTGLL